MPSRVGGSAGRAAAPEQRSLPGAAAQTYDLRLVPLAAAAWVAELVIIGGFSWWWGAIAALVLVGLLFRLFRSPTWLVVALLATLIVASLVAWLRLNQVAGSALAQLARNGTAVELTGEVFGDPRSVGQAERPFVVVVVRVESVLYPVGTASEQQLVQLVGSGSQADGLLALDSGASVVARCRLTPAEFAANLAGECNLRGAPEVSTPPDPLSAWITGLRAGLVNAMRASPAAQAALVPSFVVGDTSAVDEPTREAFQKTSLTHLMAVSGSNLTLLLGFLIATAKLAGLRGWWIRAVVFVGVCLFVVVCRGEPSVLRAAVMGGIALAAAGRARGGPRGIRQLATAVLVLLLWDPFLSLSWGFALSVAACLGIMFWASDWQAKMRGWAGGWLAEALCVPLAAQLATMPLIIALSGEVSLVGVVANMLAGPFVGPATLLGLGAVIGSQIWGPLGVGFGWLAGWVVQPILWLASGFGSLPRASVLVGGGALVVIGSLLAVWVLSRLIPRGLASRAGVVLAVLVVCVVAWWRPSPTARLPDWLLASCDVGQGDATVLAAAPGSAVLVDVGPADGEVADCLQRIGVKRIPLLVLTHYHADHIGGLADVLAAFDVDLVLVSPLASPAMAAAEVADSLANVGAVVRVASPGESLSVGQVSWTTIGPIRAASDPPVATDGESQVENDASIVGVARVGDLRVLLAGDAETAGQSAALSSAMLLGESLAVDVLKLPHHGSSQFDPDLYSASKATLALASAGSGNPYGHPSAKALDEATSLGMVVLRTDTEGLILITRRGNELAIYRAGKRG